MDGKPTMLGPGVDWAPGRLPGPPPFLGYEEALHRIDALHYTRPERVTDVTLSGALMSAGGVALELNSPSRVDGHSGIIDFLGSLTGTCFGEVYVRLRGAEQGASYLGQLRCAAEVAPGHEGEAHIGANVFGGVGGSQYGKAPVHASPLIVPFLLAEVLPGIPWAAFHPSGLRNWHVYDVRIGKV